MEKKRRRRFRFSLGALLIAIFFASIGFGWYAYLKQQSDSQMEAVAFFRDHDVKPIEETELAQIQEVPITVNGISSTMVIPSVRNAGRDIYWLEPYLGEYFFAKYTVLQIISTDKLELGELKDNMKQLPWLEHVIMSKPRYSATEIDQLRKDFPDVEFSVYRDPQPDAR